MSKPKGDSLKNLREDIKDIERMIHKLEEYYGVTVSYVHSGGFGDEDGKTKLIFEIE